MNTSIGAQKGRCEICDLDFDSLFLHFVVDDEGCRIVSRSEDTGRYSCICGLQFADSDGMHRHFAEILPYIKQHYVVYALANG